MSFEHHWCTVWANALQFGLDQLLEAPHQNWFPSSTGTYWTHNVVQLVVTYLQLAVLATEATVWVRSEEHFIKIYLLFTVVSTIGLAAVHLVLRYTYTFWEQVSTQSRISTECSSTGPWSRCLHLLGPRRIVPGQEQIWRTIHQWGG